MQFILWMVAVALLAGCSTADTTGKHIRTDVEITIRDCGEVYFDSGLATQSRDNPVSPENTAAFEGNLDFMIDWLRANGMTKAANKLKSVLTEQPEPDVEVITSIPKKQLPGEIIYETKFHHLGGPDPGPSLVLCPNDTTKYDICESNGRTMRFTVDDGRHSWWDSGGQEGSDIICTFGDKTFYYKGHVGRIDGDC